MAGEIEAAIGQQQMLHPVNVSHLASHATFDDIA
jgi:hypothetical protein